MRPRNSPLTSPHCSPLTRRWSQPALTGTTITTAIRYYYVNGLRVAEQRDGVWTWTHSDHLHSATVITDTQGAEIRRLSYHAFGEQADNSGTGTTPKYTYTAKETDQTGLMYYGARYYDPVLARFITADTMYDVGAQGLNRYSYALNNPIIYNDPTGHLSLSLDDDLEVWNKTKEGFEPPITIEKGDEPKPYMEIDGKVILTEDEVEEIVLESQGEIRADPNRGLLRSNPVSRYAGDVMMFVTSLVSSDYKATNCNAITRECYSDRESFDRRLGIFTDVAMMTAISKVGKLSKTVKGTSRKLIGKEYPTKRGYLGKPQPYDPATGRYLPFSANSGLKMSPLVRYGGGVSIALAEGEGASSGARPIGVAGRLGYQTGQVISLLKNLF